MPHVVCTSGVVTKVLVHCSVMEGFTDATVTMDARYAWKYGASRGITGTPQFLVNGVHTPDAPTYTMAQWKQFLDQLLATPTTKW